MFQVPVFKAERDAGLEAAIRSSASVALASVVRSAERGDLSEQAVARLRSLAHNFARGAQGDFDLHHLTTILVTTGWNKNDDVFDGVETWVSRKTPEDKQLNYEHDDNKIVGHITSNWVIGDDGKVVPEDTVIDDLPAKFHVVTGGVLYKCWQTPELQERMDGILADIAKGRLFVSMECLFKGFDYALKGADGSTRVVARNEKTAFLSKHLRCYGGSGQYGDARIGRLMRNIVFSGKGLVKNPANPESVILQSDAEPFNSASAEHVANFSQLFGEQVYPLATEQSAEERTQESQQLMTVTVEQLQAELAGLKSENEKLKASQQDAAVADLKGKLDAAAAAKAAADDLLQKANDALTALRTQAAEQAAAAEALKAQLDEAAKSLAESQAELKTLYAEKTTLARVATAKDKLKFTDEQAAEFVEANATLNDEQFGKQVEVLTKAMTAWVTNNPQPGNTAFSGPAGKTPPKATDKPTAPKATDKPAPNKASEADAAGEEAAAATDLDAATAAAEPALSAAVTDSGVSELQKLIASALGYKDEPAAE